MADPRPLRGLSISSDPDETRLEQPGGAATPRPGRLPLRLLLVSDLTPGAEAGAAPHRVDKHTFADLMATLEPHLDLDVPNQIGTAPRHHELTLRFPELKAFDPDEVAKQIPPLAPLLRMRASIRELVAGRLDADTLRSRLAEADLDPDLARRIDRMLTRPSDPSGGSSRDEAASNPARGDGDALDRVMAMVDPGGTSGRGSDDEDRADDASAGRSSADDIADAFVGAVAGPERSTVARGRGEELLRDLDDLIARQVGAVVADPAFRRLEAAWRGLNFLVDRIDFRRGVQLEALATPKDRLSETLYHQVLLPEHEGTSERLPLTTVLLDYTFDHGAADVELLNDLAETGASLQAPLVGAVGAAFFGTSTEEAIADVPPLGQHLGRPEYIAFNKLRERKEARFLALALPSFLLRAPHGAERTAEALPLQEASGLWGGAALAVGVAIAGSFVDTGWPTHLTGSARAIENLPLAKGRSGQLPLAALIPESKHSDFAKAGFVVLSGAANRDAVHLTRANTVCRPEAYEDLMAATEARVHVTLACQLFVARAVQQVLALQDEIVAGDDPAAAVREAESRLRTFFSADGRTAPPEAVTVEHVAERDGPDQMLLAVRLRTPREVMERPVSLVLGLPLRKQAPAA